ncbi:hypothetical protein ABH309_21110 [Chromobacterium piscinae]|uniref:OmpR/PhoB-type domain-containing protein n=1 Tax=Chromobacterium piscinae TaxID=686831 RepID=A0ABV0HA23_9NEIS
MRFELCEHFLFDSVSQTLHSQNDVQAHLSYRTAILLTLVLQGETSKRVIMDTIWRGGDVGDGSYHKLIFELRNQLQSIGMDPDVIKTLPRRGCCFIGSVRSLEDGQLPASWPEKTSQVPLEEDKKISALMQPTSNIPAVENSFDHADETRSALPRLSGERPVSTEIHNNNVMPRVLSDNKIQTPNYLSPRLKFFWLAMFLACIAPSLSAVILNQRGPKLKVSSHNGRTIVSVGQSQAPEIEGLPHSKVYKRRLTGGDVYYVCTINELKEQVCENWLFYR